MEKLNTIEIGNVLKDVRNSYRVLALYQQRILDTINYIGNQYNFQFQSGWTKFGRGTANGKTASQNGQGWDWLSFYLYEFNMGNIDIEDKRYSFKIVHQADTGFYDVNEIILKKNVESFASVETSETRLFFVLSENANGCPIHNVLKNHLSSETSGPIKNGDWLAVPYDISSFLNQESTDVVIKHFNAICMETFGVDLLIVKE